MSVVKVRAALETAVNTMTPGLQTAYENAPFKPTIGTPYQRCNILFAEPGNQEFGANYQELGFMQLTLFYPIETGAGAANARAELIRQTFRRGNSFQNGGLSVVIDKTPEVKPGANDGSFYVLPVRVRFYANTY
jgi:hypothetical protein